MFDLHVCLPPDGSAHAARVRVRARSDTLAGVAHVNFDGLNLRVTLAPPERRAVHRRELVVARSQLAGVRHAPDLWSLVRHNVTVLGLGYPGLLMWGTATNRDGQDFCILNGHGPGLAVELRASSYERLLLSMPDAESWPLFVRVREVILADAGAGKSPPPTP